MISTLFFLFFWQITRYKCTSYKQVVNCYYITFIIFGYTVEHQSTPMTTATKIQVRACRRTNVFLFLNFFVDRSHVENWLQSEAANCYTCSKKTSQNTFHDRWVKTQPGTVLFA